MKNIENNLEPLESINLIRYAADDDNLTVTRSRNKWFEYTQNFIPHHNFLYECHESILIEYLNKWFKDKNNDKILYRILECTDESAWMNYNEYYQLFSIAQFRDSKGFHVRVNLDSIDDGGWGSFMTFPTIDQADEIAKKIKFHFEQNNPYDFKTWHKFCWLWGIELNH